MILYSLILERGVLLFIIAHIQYGSMGRRALFQKLHLLVQNCIFMSHVKHHWIYILCYQTFSEIISIFEQGFIPIYSMTYIFANQI